MTTLKIADRQNQTITWGKFGQDLLSYPRAKESWARKTVLNGGYHDGFVTLPPELDVVKFFNNGLGYGLTELNGSDVKWEGYIHEMVLRGNVDMINSYDNIFNSVSAQTANYLNNGGFEKGGLSDWIINTGDGSLPTVTSDTSLVGRGLYSALLESNITNTGNTSDRIKQQFDCNSQTTYRLTFYHSGGTGDTSARYKIVDSVGDIVDIISVESSGGRYRRETIDFITHYGATWCRVILYVPEKINETVYYDDVRVERVVNDRPVSGITPVTENDESIITYGRKQKVLKRFPTMEDAENARDTFLLSSAYPNIVRGGISFAEPGLDIYVRGYMETLNWITWTLQTGGAKVSALTVLNHIQGNNEFVNSVIVDCNPPDVYMPDPFLTTQADAVKMLMAQIGSNYRIGMKAGKQIVLETVKFAPRYFMRSGRVYPDAVSAQVGVKQINERDIEPAVVRDLDNPLSGKYPNSVYQDRRDFVMASVEVTGDNVSFGSSNIGKFVPMSFADAVDTGDLFD